MLTEAQVAEIRRRVERGSSVGQRWLVEADVDALLADRDELVRMGDLHRGEIAELVRRLATLRERAIWLPTAEWPHCVQHYGGDVSIPHCHLCTGEWQPTCSEVHDPPDCPAAPVAAATIT